MAVYITDHSTSLAHSVQFRQLPPTAHNTDVQILDIGCGPGSISVDFARRANHGHVIGIENVPDPLDQARHLAASQGVTNVDFRLGDIHALEFPDNTFDIVHVHQVLQHIIDPVKALCEMRRIVKRGGIVAARESASMIWYPENVGIDNWLEITQRMGKAKGGNPHPGRYIHVWAEGAGFDLANIRKSTGSWCFSTPEERQYWGGSMGERVRSSGLAKTAVEEGYATKEELERISKGWREFVEDEQAWFGLLHGEMLCWK
ncbi:UbiE/COQ5 family methyltransferase [Penicillium bovifimosum]|uniref:UbiE/COQ5 family methyltransferase n=1 Tax=Penicillium bovifimosum TaxID=126998 RepID=A0A9W9KV76_9EURO|nr:UbiE/COQ5 family methyltransferase [Penicillium bovifimosum]KAJ5120635.1 UbiE/COQ5 family methyltransferase [Penicillium bovifimosum]